MARKTQKLNLSEHTLDINTRSFDVDLFDFSEFEDFVKALTGNREYQFNAIRDILIYLWGGRYKSILDLAKENYTKQAKDGLRQRFEGLDHFLATMPLPDRLSGVCHMATGTGKSYVMFAVAYISLLLGKVDRVLLIGPSSTIIEQGLTEKFKEHLYGETGIRLREMLPEKYRSTVIKLLNANSVIEDNSIVIENVNAVYSQDNNAIGDTLFARGNRVLVLSDEVHHAYSHLTFTGGQLRYNFDPNDITTSKKGSVESEERLWMKFLREKPIAWHIGFTGTPYNQDEYFTDIIYNYSLKDAIENKYIKKIDAVLSIDGGEELTKGQRLEQIIQTHIQNRKKYSYPDAQNMPRIKPITIFINSRQATAKANAEEFKQALARYYSVHINEYEGMSKSDLEVIANAKIIIVTSDSNKGEYQKQLEAIEECDPSKIGGQVEFIFAVNKLSEGWDVDNVFQIVPSEERVFNSKLLISQVLGRGLRLPRNPAISFAQIQMNYPKVTITNHEKFGPHVKELYDQVTECELRFNSRPLSNEQKRAQHHFSLFNLSYLPTQRTEPKEPTQKGSRSLILDQQPDALAIKITYLEGARKYKFDKEFVTVDQVVADITRKFKNVAFEHTNYDFQDELEIETLPQFDTIQETVKQAMDRVGIQGNKLSIENKKKIELYFNQFISKQSKRVIRENIEGSVYGLHTSDIPSSSVNIGRLDNEISIFLSEDYEKELPGGEMFIMDQLQRKSERLKKKATEGQLGILDATPAIETEYVRPFIVGEAVYLVNPSMFRTPQSAIIVSHKPENDFVFHIIENSKKITGWVKSPDAGFYSLEYEFWKKSKDRVKRSFNPDFFIKTTVELYSKGVSNAVSKEQLRQLEDSGIEDIIFVVEIKAEEDFKEETIAKDEYGGDHFTRVNNILNDRGSEIFNPANLEEPFRSEYRQHYIFDLLRQDDISSWFKRFNDGTLVIPK